MTDRISRLAEGDPNSRGSEAERLRILFRRSTSLPQLPRSASRLVEAIDSDDVSASVLEGIISTDPALATAVMRIANSALFGHETHVTTIRAAILRIGLRAVRSVAISFSVTQLTHMRPETDLFCVDRFASHSVMVGLLSRYLFARSQQVSEFDTEWSADEIFAAGVLHDISSALLASKAPEVYERTFNYAKRTRSGIPDAFKRIYGASLGELSAQASEAWGLPTLFTTVIRYIEEPWNSQREFEAIACLHYANYIADRYGHSLVDWTPDKALEPEVEDLLKIEDSEIAYVVEQVEEHARHLLDDAAGAAA